jgi:hypothetical protein
VLVPVSQFIRTLVSARLAADVMGVGTLVIARTDAHSASLLTSDIDERDHPFLTGERTPEGFYRIRSGLEIAIARAVAYAPYADVLWCETSTPDLGEAREFAEGVHAKYPGKLLAYNCSPSFNWAKKLSQDEIATFQRELGAMGYKFQFVTLAGFHALNFSMYELARQYRDEGMAAYSRMQQSEFAAEQHRLHGHPPSTRGGHRLLRRGGEGGQRRRVVDDRTRRINGGRAVLAGTAGSAGWPSLGHVRSRRGELSGAGFRNRSSQIVGDEAWKTFAITASMTRTNGTCSRTTSASI